MAVAFDLADFQKRRPGRPRTEGDEARMNRAADMMVANHWLKPFRAMRAVLEAENPSTPNLDNQARRLMAKWRTARSGCMARAKRRHFEKQEAKRMRAEMDIWTNADRLNRMLAAQRQALGAWADITTVQRALGAWGSLAALQGHAASGLAAAQAMQSRVSAAAAAIEASAATAQAIERHWSTATAAASAMERQFTKAAMLEREAMNLLAGPTNALAAIRAAEAMSVAHSRPSVTHALEAELQVRQQVAEAMMAARLAY